MGEMKDRIARGELYIGTDDDLTAEYRRGLFLEPFIALGIGLFDVRDRRRRRTAGAGGSRIRGCARAGTTTPSPAAAAPSRCLSRRLTL